MDISKEYIKMCEKAVEIQEIRNQLGLGDYYSPYGHGFSLHGENKLIDKHDIIWLPRQDQLQDMVKGRGNNTYMGMAKQFADAIWTKPFEKLLFASMEQLWLAFVMSERYSKVWSGTDWINLKGLDYGKL